MERLENIANAESREARRASRYRRVFMYYALVIGLGLLALWGLYALLESLGWSGARVAGIPIFVWDTTPNFSGSALGGVVNVGGFAAGLIAVGGGAIGAVAVGGAAVGLIAVGGGSVGVIAIGGGSLGIIAIGGNGCGYYFMGYTGVGKHILSLQRQDPEAERFFCRRFPGLGRALTESE